MASGCVAKQDDATCGRGASSGSVKSSDNGINEMRGVVRSWAMQRQQVMVQASSFISGVAVVSPLEHHKTHRARCSKPFAPRKLRKNAVCEAQKAKHDAQPQIASRYRLAI
ncbi:hypothetical protein NDU88_005353 [Pleurodeles waltl]|uniref:Uncharacterized protein n=1 Tax=Pleurodeles waltl TaxID=8319 RepID=A0AAV7SLJ0_PLEWA|nr:hypothetical protein NDU88_005353 [Pleurodeles waltl]